MWKQNREIMRTFTEEELQQAIVDAFDAGTLHGVSWGKLDELPHLLDRRALSYIECGKIITKAIRNQNEKQS